MTKFEQRGVMHQYEAVDAEDAKRKFRISCDICCNHGMHIDCEKCAIANANSLVMAVFADKANEIA